MTSSVRRLFSFRGRADRLLRPRLRSVAGQPHDADVPRRLRGHRPGGRDKGGAAGGIPAGRRRPPRAMVVPWAMIVVGVACGVASLWLLTATNARRIQDLGFSGWHTAWVMALIFLGGYAPNGVASAVLGILGWSGLLLLALLPGTRGDNLHGRP